MMLLAYGLFVIASCIAVFALMRAAMKPIPGHNWRKCGECGRFLNESGHVVSELPQQSDGVVIGQGICARCFAAGVQKKFPRRAEDATGAVTNVTN